MDFLALYITARLTHTPVRPLRLSFAAAVGAIYSLIAVLIDTVEAAIPMQSVSFVLGLLCVYVMAVITYSRAPREALKAASAYVAVSIGLGGIMTATGSMLTRLTQHIEAPAASVSPVTSPGAFIIVALISGAVSLLYGKLRASSMAKKKADVVLTAFGRECKLTLLCDSGNLLREPIGGKPVLIISISKLNGTLPNELQAVVSSPLSITELSPELSRRIRLIPTTGVMGNGILLGFIPDKLVMDGHELDAAVAVDAKNNSFGGCDGVIPQILLTA